MKYVWQIFIVLTLTFLYRTTSSDFHSDYYNSFSQIENTLIAEVHEDLQHELSDIDTDASLSSVNISAPVIPYSVVQKQLNDFHFFTIFSVRVHYISSLQFEIFSTNLMKRFRETDIIFPFHFFW